mgnify:CR=1 FL=1
MMDFSDFFYLFTWMLKFIQKSFKKTHKNKINAIKFNFKIIFYLHMLRSNLIKKVNGLKLIKRFFSLID